jgi:hypothetical protein
MEPASLEQPVHLVHTSRTGDGKEGKMDNGINEQFALHELLGIGNISVNQPKHWLRVKQM